jgi:Bacterial PH domain
MAAPAPQFEVHYLAAGRLVAWFVVAVGVLGILDIVFSGDVRDSRGLLLGIVAICLLAYVLGLRPAVVEDVGGVRVRNPLRTSLVPWGSVTNVDVTDVLRVHAGTTVVRCFAIPRRRPRSTRPALGALGWSRPATDFGFPEEPAAARRKSSSRPAAGPPVSRADMVAGRLRTQAEQYATASGAGPVDVRLAPDALWTLVAALLLGVLAVVLG